MHRYSKSSREYEQHFNQIQSTYRSLASTWLLATFAGIGFIMTQNLNIIEGLPKDIMIEGIAVAGSLGIYLIWNLDHTVYQGLLDSVFFEGIKLENQYSWLPQVRNNMMRREDEGRDVISRLKLFYLLLQIVLYLIAIFLGFHLDGTYWLIHILAIIFPLLIMAICFYDMSLSLKKSETFLKSLKIPP